MRNLLRQPSGKIRVLAVLGLPLFAGIVTSASGQILEIRDTFQPFTPSVHSNFLHEGTTSLFALPDALLPNEATGDVDDHLTCAQDMGATVAIDQNEVAAKTGVSVQPVSPVENYYEPDGTNDR